MSVPLHPDHSLVQAAIRREPEAVEWLTQRMLRIPRLVKYLARRASGPAHLDLEDVAQSAALVILRRLEAYHGLAPFDAWVHRVCLLTLRGASRRDRNRRTSELPADLVAVYDLTLIDLLDAERQVTLHAALDGIGGVEAEVIRWHDLEGLDFANISARTGIPVATLRTRYYRGRSKLQMRLLGGPLEEGGPA